MEKILKIKPHTVIMTIGPSNCGKTWFCQNLLTTFLESHEINYKYFSSDTIRRNLLFVNLDKNDRKMSSVSKQAFSILETGVDNYSQYPVNAKVIIVDATHLSKMSRENIISICKKNNYSLTGLLFDYKNKKDYFKYEGQDKKVIADMVRKLREETLQELERNEFETIFRIDTNDFSNIKLQYEEKKNYETINYDKVSIVGDIHGCLQELITLVTDNTGITYNPETNLLSKSDQGTYVQHILVGDLIDKGPNIKEVIEFIYLNKDFFKIVKGNHENWVSEYLLGHIRENEVSKMLIEKWFNTVPFLEKDEVLKEKFFEIINSSFDFIVDESGEYIVTHSPCKEKYLGKQDPKSLKKQRNFVYPKKADFATEELYLDAREDAFKFLITEANSSFPLHVFGHTPVPKIFKYRNKVCVDTGCVTGGFLSCIIIEKGKYASLKQYPSKQNFEGDKPIAYFRTREQEIDYSSLDFELKKRLKWAAHNQVNFIAGTMCPCDKLEDNLESLEAGINYFKSKGVSKLVFQPKYMGSRAQVLLRKKK